MEPSSRRAFSLLALVMLASLMGLATAFAAASTAPRPGRALSNRPLTWTTTSTATSLASWRDRHEGPSHHPLAALTKYPVRKTQLASSVVCSSSVGPIPGAKAYKLLSAIRGGGGQSASNMILTGLSVAIGYVIITGSLFFKIPQVARIFRKKSAEGISAYMYSMETVGVAMSLLFSIRNAFPFSTYGEAVFILLQNIAILIGMSIYGENPKPPVLAGVLVIMAASFVYFLAPSTPAVYASVLQSLSIPLLNISRIPQILLNYRRKSTGELAPSTLILQAAGNLARIFTTLVQVKNRLFLFSALVAMIFNGLLCYQFFLYKPKPAVA